MFREKFKKYLIEIFWFIEKLLLFLNTLDLSYKVDPLFIDFFIMNLMLYSHTYCLVPM